MKFTFFVFNWRYVSWSKKKKWSKKSKLSVYGEIWYLVLFKSTEFNSELFYFWLGMPFLIQKWKLLVWKLSRLIRICIFNVLPILFWICRIQWWWHSLFSLFDWEYHFKVNLIQKNQIVVLRLNLLPKLILICRSQSDCHFKLKFGT